MSIVARGMGLGSSPGTIVAFGLGLQSLVAPPIEPPVLGWTFGGGGIGGATESLSEFLRRQREIDAVPLPTRKRRIRTSRDVEDEELLVIAAALLLH